MLHTAYKVTATRNAYGDYIAGGETAYSCHFREITQVGQRSGNTQIDSDAMAWFNPDAPINKLDIIKVNGVHYQVDKVTKARRLHDPATLFLKVELLKYGVIS